MTSRRRPFRRCTRCNGLGWETVDDRGQGTVRRCLCTESPEAAEARRRIEEMREVARRLGEDPDIDEDAI